MTTASHPYMRLPLLLKRVTRTVLKTGHEFLLVVRNHEEMSTPHSHASYALEKTRLQVRARSVARPSALVVLVGDHQLLAVEQHLVGRNDDRLLFYGEQ